MIFFLEIDNGLKSKYHTLQRISLYKIPYWFKRLYLIPGNMIVMTQSLLRVGVAVKYPCQKITEWP